MRLLDLFSGIGGFSLAAQWVWGDELEIVAFVEIDKFCQKVLKKYWPDVPIIEDVRDVTGMEFGAVDIITGGVPCQPASVAGKRKGTEDSRWLWEETIRVFGEIKPQYAVFENPTGILSLQGGIPFEHILSSLENKGYEIQPIIIPACSKEALYKRERVFIVAFSTSNRLEGKLLKGGNKKVGTLKTFSTLSLPSREEQLPQPYTLRSLNGIPNGIHRLKSLGNAIVPQVAEVIFRAIKEIEDNANLS